MSKGNGLTTLMTAMAMTNSGPYHYDILKDLKPIKTKEKVDSGIFIVKVRKQYIGVDGLVDKKEDAYKYDSFTSAKSNNLGKVIRLR